MTESNRGRARRGVLAAVVVLALLAGVVSDVAARSGPSYENDTNTTDGVVNATNDSTVSNDTGYTVAAIPNETYGTASVGVDGTDVSARGSGNELVPQGLSVDGPDRIERLLGDDPRLLTLLDRMEPGIEPLAGDGRADSNDRGATAETGRAAHDRGLREGERVPTASRGPAIVHSADGALVPAVPDDGGESANAGAGGGDTPLGLTGVAVGLQAVVAGVAVRELTDLPADLPAPARTASVTGRRMVDRVPRLFAPLRYSRYDDSDPLEHEDRARVFETIDDSPGVYLSELSERTGVSLSTLRHHVKVLEREDLIAAARVRGRRRFYPAHTDDVELAAAMNDEATAPIVDALARLGAVTVSDLADADGRDASTVTHHLQRLEADGLVVREREGRAIVNRLAAEVREALAPLGETRADPAEPEATVSAD